jgi:hypothetical protein
MNLRVWLTMLWLRASDEVWNDIRHEMTSQNELIYKMFEHYDCYLAVMFLAEFYIIFPLRFILPYFTYFIYSADL